MLVRGIGLRDISAVLQISITKVLKVLKSTKYQIKPKQTHYDRLETDEFWTYAGKRRTKCGLFTRITGKAGKYSVCMGEEGSEDGEKTEETAETAWDKYDRVATDDCFVSAFAEDKHDTGKKHTTGIEGNNCRMRGAFRRTCCFSRKLRNHWKAFAMAFFTSTMVSSESHHTLWITSRTVLYR
jgi:IS1 family transposase